MTGFKERIKNISQNFNGKRNIWTVLKDDAPTQGHFKNLLRVIEQEVKQSSGACSVLAAQAIKDELKTYPYKSIQNATEAVVTDKLLSLRQISKSIPGYDVSHDPLEDLFVLYMIDEMLAVNELDDNDLWGPFDL